MQTSIYTLSSNITTINKQLIKKINKYKIYKKLNTYLPFKTYDDDFIIDISLYNNILLEISNLYKYKDSKVNFNAINKIEAFNFEVIDNYLYNTCNILLENGFYPYMDMNISVVFVKTLNKKSEIIREINSLVEMDMKKLKNKMKIVLKKYKNIVNNIYRLYYKKEYRACILMIINLLSILYNDIYKYIGLNDESIKNKLISFGVLKDNQRNFIELSPYILDNNYILKYKSDYNMYEIMLGHTDKYATKTNTLRYMSVLMNTMNLFDIYL